MKDENAKVNFSNLADLASRFVDGAERKQDDYVHVAALIAVVDKDEKMPTEKKKELVEKIFKKERSFTLLQYLASNLVAPIIGPIVMAIVQKVRTRKVKTQKFVDSVLNADNKKNGGIEENKEIPRN